MGRKITTDGGTFALDQAQYERAVQLYETAERMRDQAVIDAASYWYWDFFPDAGAWDLFIHDDTSSYDDEAPMAFLRAIAPAVPAGQYIVMESDDGDHWRYLFDGQTVALQYGSVIFVNP